MTARASIYYDCSYLRDVLFIEGASGRVEGNGVDINLPPSRIHINLDSDEVIDELVTALTALQRASRCDKLRSEIAHLERKLERDVADRKDRYKEWNAARGVANSTESELFKTRQALAKLEKSGGAK